MVAPTPIEWLQSATFAILALKSIPRAQVNVYMQLFVIFMQICTLLVPDGGVGAVADITTQSVYSAVDGSWNQYFFPNLNGRPGAYPMGLWKFANLDELRRAAQQLQLAPLHPISKGLSQLKDTLESAIYSLRRRTLGEFQLIVHPMDLMLLNRMQRATVGFAVAHLDAHFCGHPEIFVASLICLITEAYANVEHPPDRGDFYVLDDYDKYVRVSTGGSKKRKEVCHNLSLICALFHGFECAVTPEDRCAPEFIGQVYKWSGVTNRMVLEQDSDAVTPTGRYRIKLDDFNQEENDRLFAAMYLLVHEYGLQGVFPVNFIHPLWVEAGLKYNFSTEDLAGLSFLLDRKAPHHLFRQQVCCGSSRCCNGNPSA